MDGDADMNREQLDEQKQNATEFLETQRAEANTKYNGYQLQSKQRSNVRNDEAIAHQTMAVHNNIENAVDKVLALKYNSTQGSRRALEKQHIQLYQDVCTSNKQEKQSVDSVIRLLEKTYMNSDNAELKSHAYTSRQMQRWLDNDLHATHELMAEQTTVLQHLETVDDATTVNFRSNLSSLNTNMQEHLIKLEPRRKNMIENTTRKNTEIAMYHTKVHSNLIAELEKGSYDIQSDRFRNFVVEAMSRISEYLSDEIAMLGGIAVWPADKSQKSWFDVHPLCCSMPEKTLIDELQKYLTSVVTVQADDLVRMSAANDLEGLKKVVSGASVLMQDVSSSKPVELGMNEKITFAFATAV